MLGQPLCTLPVLCPVTAFLPVPFKAAPHPALWPGFLARQETQTFLLPQARLFHWHQLHLETRWFVPFSGFLTSVSCSQTPTFLSATGRGPVPLSPDSKVVGGGLSRPSPAASAQQRQR